MKAASLKMTMAVLAILGSARAGEPLRQERLWEATIASLVEVLVQQGDPRTLSNLVSPNAFIAPFDLNRTEAFMVLPDRLITSNVVSARAYIHPSVSCASDIVDDLRANGTIDAETMHRLAPQNEADLRKADATVARWFETALDVKSGDPVAVLVLYDDGKGEPIRAPQLSFVLVRGELTHAGQPRISRALYGSMQSAAK